MTRPIRKTVPFSQVTLKEEPLASLLDNSLVLTLVAIQRSLERETRDIGPMILTWLEMSFFSTSDSEIEISSASLDTCRSGTCPVNRTRLSKTVTFIFEPFKRDFFFDSSLSIRPSRNLSSIFVPMDRSATSPFVVQPRKKKAREKSVMSLIFLLVSMYMFLVAPAPR